MDVDSAVKVALAAATVGIMGLAAALYPDSRGTASEPLDVLAARFARRERRSRARYALWCVVVLIPLAFLFQAASDWHARSVAPAVVVLGAGPVFWFTPSLFMAIGIAATIVARIDRAELGEQFADYQAYRRLKDRRDNVRTSRIACWSMGFACAIAAYAGLDWYFLAGSDSIVINRFLSLQDERRACADVRAIRTASHFIALDSRRKFRREYLFEFTEGTWSTDNNPRFLAPEERRDVAVFVSDRCGVPIEDVGTFDAGVL